MASVSQNPESAGPRPVTSTPPASLKVSNRDRTAASLLAMLILVGTCVALLLIIWVTTRVWIRNVAVAPQLIEPLSGGGNALGDSRELVEPGSDELEDLAEPQLEETLDSVTEMVTDQLATLDTLGGSAASTTTGSGGGDPRAAGPGQGESQVVPRWQRWEVEFNPASAQLYAQQLDALGIELAATGGGSSQIDYLAELSSGEPVRREGSSAADDRLYMTHRYGKLRDLDAAFLQRAGIKTRDRVIMQFYPAVTENLLALAEREYLVSKQRRLEQIKRTTFGVRSEAGSYGFFVKQQQLQR